MEVDSARHDSRRDDCHRFRGARRDARRTRRGTGRNAITDRKGTVRRKADVSVLFRDVIQIDAQPVAIPGNRKKARHVLGTWIGVVVEPALGCSGIISVVYARDFHVARFHDIDTLVTGNIVKPVKPPVICVIVDVPNQESMAGKVYVPSDFLAIFQNKSLSLNNLEIPGG